jgi:hypothetical protein
VYFTCNDSGGGYWLIGPSANITQGYIRGNTVYVQSGTGANNYSTFNSSGLLVTGTVTATVNVTVSSDRTLKENIVPYRYKPGAPKIHPVSFDWKDTGEHTYGFIAQDVELVIPEAVYTSPTTGLKTLSFMPVLAHAMARIERLERELKILRGERPTDEEMDAALRDVE